MLRAMAQGVKKAEVTVALALRYSSGVSKVLSSCASDCHSLGFGSNASDSPPQPLYRARISCSSVVAGRLALSMHFRRRNADRLSISLIRAVDVSNSGSCDHRKQDGTIRGVNGAGDGTKAMTGAKAKKSSSV